MGAWLVGCAGSGAGPAADVPDSSRVAAEACAAKLPPRAALIYKEAAPDVHASTDMESLLRVKVLFLVIRGEMTRTNARPAAEAAVDCLEMLQR